MSYNGAGVFQINSAGQPVVTGTTISSTAFNALTADLATGLSTAVLKDGTQTATASIPLQQGFSVGAGAAFAMNSSGTVITLLDISNAAAGQIKFPATQNPSANANTLDDYEEGTWVPADASGATLTLTINSTATYIKIGQVVHAEFDITYPATGNGANSLISGLPFTTRTTTNGFGAAIGFQNAGTGLACLTVPNSVNFLLNLGGSPATNTNMSAKTVRAIFTYFAAA